MDTDNRGKLGDFLREVIDLRWDEFLEKKNDAKITGYEAVVLALVYACSEGKLSAIKTAIDRIDGKEVTPVKIEFPKVFIIFPEAKSIAPPVEGGEVAAIEAGPEPTPEVETEFIDPAEEEASVVTLTLRDTLKSMADQSQVLIKLILDRKNKVERGEELPEDGNIPLVKAVICANLLHLAGKSNFEAITEVFDRIDGKMVETIKIMGQDMYIPSFLLEAPHGAVKNKDGIYQIEDPRITAAWKEKLKKD